MPKILPEGVKSRHGASGPSGPSGASGKPKDKYCRDRKCKLKKISGAHWGKHVNVVHGGVAPMFYYEENLPTNVVPQPNRGRRSIVRVRAPKRRIGEIRHWFCSHCSGKIRSDEWKLHLRAAHHGMIGVNHRRWTEHDENALIGRLEQEEHKESIPNRNEPTLPPNQPFRRVEQDRPGGPDSLPDPAPGDWQPSFPSQGYCTHIIKHGEKLGTMCGKLVGFRENKGGRPGYYCVDHTQQRLDERARDMQALRDNRKKANKGHRKSARGRNPSTMASIISNRRKATGERKASTKVYWFKEIDRKSLLKGGKLLAEGSYGKVIKSFCVSMNEFQAVKIAKSGGEIAYNEEKQLRLKVGLTAEHLPKIYQFDDEAQAIAMELMEGDLHGVIKNPLNKGGMEPDVLCRFLYTMLKGLQAFHDKKIAHRDIKADNFLVKKGKAYLNDYII